jgi:hypothetical protein
MGVFTVMSWTLKLKQQLIGQILAILGNAFCYEPMDQEMDFRLDFRIKHTLPADTQIETYIKAIQNLRLTHPLFYFEADYVKVSGFGRFMVVQLHTKEYYLDKKAKLEASFKETMDEINGILQEFV